MSVIIGRTQVYHRIQLWPGIVDNINLVQSIFVQAKAACMLHYCKRKKPPLSENSTNFRKTSIFFDLPDGKDAELTAHKQHIIQLHWYVEHAKNKNEKIYLQPCHLAQCEWYRYSANSSALTSNRKDFFWAICNILLQRTLTCSFRKQSCRSSNTPIGFKPLAPGLWCATFSWRFLGSPTAHY